MESIKILLCCGAGMSSGMLASKARKAAKKRGLDAQVSARSESEVYKHLQSIDILFLGPHFALHKEQFEKMAEPFNVPVLVIPKQIYGLLDGEKLIELALNALAPQPE